MECYYSYFVIMVISLQTGLYRFTAVNIVMGNESCDLDSATSALVYGYLLYSEMNADTRNTVAVVPLLNICKKELPLKTEVTYYLKKNDIPLDLLVFQLGISNHYGAGSSIMVKALCYKPEGRGFDTR
jgi:inorganic pyrophosphatase/exopolyphosphatase